MQFLKMKKTLLIMIQFVLIILTGRFIENSFAIGTGFDTLYLVDHIIKDEFINSLSPSIANSLLKSRTLINLYQQGETLEEAPYMANLQSTDKLIEDPLVKFIRSLFYMVPGDTKNLRVPSTTSIFSNHIRPSTLGIIYDQLLVKKSKNTKELIDRIHSDFFPPVRIEEIKTELLRGNGERGCKLFPIIDNKIKSATSFKDLIDLQKLIDHDRSILRNGNNFHKLRNLQKKREQLTRELAECNQEKQPQAYNEFVKKLEDIFREIKNIEKILSNQNDLLEKEKYDTLTGMLDQLNKSIDPFKAMGFVKQLMAALDYCQDKVIPYAKNLPYQILLSQALLRSNDHRKTLLEIGKYAPDILKQPEGSELTEGGPKFSKIKLQNFFVERINESRASLELEQLQSVNSISNIETQINQIKISQTSQTRALEFLTHPDRTIPLLMFYQEELENTLPPLYNQNLDNTLFRIGGVGPEVASSDCCEATFFNFLTHFKNTASGHPKKELQELLDLSNAESSKDPNFRKKLKELFSNRSSLAYYQKEVTADGKSWSYDLRPSLDNFLSLVESLWEGFPTDPNLSRTERLQRICKMFGCRALVEPALEPAKNQPWTPVDVTFSSASDTSSDTSPPQVNCQQEEISEGPEYCSEKLAPLKLIFQIQNQHCIASRASTPNPKLAIFSRFYLSYKEVFFDDFLPLLDNSQQEQSLDNLSHILATTTIIENEMASSSRLFLINILLHYPKMKKYLFPILSQFDLSNSNG
ncbi:MAG: hypothetical protein HQK53_19890, partial [Oligoflexia bacterium]|nr:hypothetical protein [Oligoflexia bacterium]